jgi:hypothetical protein
MWLWPIGSIVLGRPRPGLPSRELARPIVDFGDELVELCLGEVLEAGAFWKVFANPALKCSFVQHGGAAHSGDTA